MICMKATYADGTIRLRDYATWHGLKWKMQRPLKVELWGKVYADIIKGILYAIEPFRGKLEMNGKLLYQSTIAADQAKQKIVDAC